MAPIFQFITEAAHACACALLRARAQMGACVQQKYRRGKIAEFVDADFAEILSGEGNRNNSKDRKMERKTKQFCRQIQRVLNLALADSGGASSACELFVDEVSPAPDCGHLLVHVVVQDGYSIADAMVALRNDAPRLRSELAMAIARKRAPEMYFVPVAVPGGDHE